MNRHQTICPEILLHILFDIIINRIIYKHLYRHNKSDRMLKHHLFVLHSPPPPPSFLVLCIYLITSSPMNMCTLLTIIRNTLQVDGHYIIVCFLPIGLCILLTIIAMIRMYVKYLMVINVITLEFMVNLYNVHFTTLLT